MKNSFSFRREAPRDFALVEALQSAAFEDAQIADLVRDLRALDAVYPTLSMVAVDAEDRPLGHVMLSHAWLDCWDRLLDVMVLSPLGVTPDQQGQGIATGLMTAALTEADQLGVPMVFLEGNDAFYGPRGFRCAVPYNIRRPSLRIPERAFQVYPLSGYQSDMTGSFVYRDVHWRHGVGLYRTW